MKNRISINSVIINQYSIEICYLIEGNCCKYFNIEKGNTFRIEYNENIERVPKNIAVIPFIVNVLPIVWLTDAILEVEELDRTFYNSINIHNMLLIPNILYTIQKSDLYLLNHL